MQVTFNPNIQNNRQQGPAFKAINREWLARIIDEPDVANNEFRIRFLNPKSGLNKQDFIDTVTESAKHFGEGFQAGFIRTIEWAKKFERN